MRSVRRKQPTNSNAGFVFQELKAQLEDHKPTVNEANDLCDWLTDKNKDQPLVAASIKDKFDKVEQPYNDLRAKVLDLEGRLQAAQMRTQEFQVSYDDFKDKLGDMEEQVADLKPVSAVYDTVKDQKELDEVSSLVKIMGIKVIVICVMIITICHDHHRYHHNLHHYYYQIITILQSLSKFVV